VEGRRASAVDVGVYGASALVAGGVALFASIPLYRQVGRIAAGPYAAGAVVALWLSVRRAGVRGRFVLALLVLTGALLLPLVLEATWRAHTSPGMHAQSEAIITEEAAKATVRGQDPYAASYVHGPLSARPLGTKTHFPYLPAMLLFGLPRAAGGPAIPTDARLAFATFTLAVVAALAWRWRRNGDRSIRLVQAMAVVPTAALLLAAGGDDLPVASLMILALALASERKPAWSGAAAGLAAAMKQTAWLVLPFLVAGVWRTQGARAARRSVAAALAVALPIVVPFVVWDPSGFVEDVLRFPIGLGRQASAAETPTAGSLLVHAVPSARTPITLLLIAVVLGVGILLLFVRPPDSLPAASLRAGALFVVAMVLAPAGRIGYVVYPIDLVAWGWLARGSLRPAEPAATAPRAAGTAPVPTG
jgi:Glycosyltransferase family 87